MRHTILLCTMLLGICSWSLPQVAMADSTPAAETKGKATKKSKKATSVVKAFKDFDFFKATEEDAEADTEQDKKEEKVTPNKRAKYYIYLSSASWCGPCKALMPEVVKQYKDMKKKKVEVILISCDHTAAEGKAYLEHYKAEFCGVMADEAAEKQLPGYKPANGIPHAIIVDKKGKVITAGHGASVIGIWKQTCK